MLRLGYLAPVSRSRLVVPSTPSVRLRLEPLDARDVPAVLLDTATGLLDIQGTSHNDTATIVQAHTPVFGDPTIEVTLVSTNAAGRVIDRGFWWFYADTVSRIEFHGGEGNDVLRAGTFLQVFAFGEGGNDQLYARGELYGGEGRDRIVASGPSVLDGGEGDDVLTASNSIDFLRGRAGNDLLQGRGGNDRMDGGEGNDRIEGGYGNDTMVGAEGNDTMFGGFGDDFIEGGSGADLISGDGWLPQAGDGNDIILGGTGADSLYGTGGNDWIDTGRDADRDQAYGGPGTDTFVYYEAYTPLGVRLWDSYGVVIGKDYFVFGGRVTT
jgi:Ca2+-binding RTX toxin-like protein